MELICPHCASLLQVQGSVASCPMHGGQYEVLFDRHAESLKRVPPAPPRGDAACAHHATQASVVDCEACDKPLCVVCACERNETFFCVDCAVNADHARPAAQALTPQPAPLPADAPANIFSASANPVEKQCPECGALAPIGAEKCPACATSFLLTRLTAPVPRARIPQGKMCTQHPDSNAVALCRGCNNGVCSTCDFLLPGGLHFCPACIDRAGDEEISPKRRKLAIAAICCAVWSTLLYPFAVSGALYRTLGSPTDAESFGCALLLILYAPSVIGTALAASAYDKRFRNTALISTARIWNLVLLAVLIVQYIVWAVS
jgi:ribosomal protein L40E